MYKSNQIVPRAREEGLIVTDFKDEILVYDTQVDKTHCLNQTAALAWRNCDGTRTVADIAQRMQAELNAPVETEMVWYALKQLDRNHLLQERVTLPAEMVTLSRRDFLKKVGAAAAVAAPIILSITVPTPAQAASCLPAGSVCTSNAQCCSGLCNVTCA
jgi:hypothetical protein